MKGGNYVFIIDEPENLIFFFKFYIATILSVKCIEHFFLLLLLIAHVFEIVQWVEPFNTHDSFSVYIENSSI